VHNQKPLQLKDEERLNCVYILGKTFLGCDFDIFKLEVQMKGVMKILRITIRQISGSLNLCFYLIWDRSNLRFYQKFVPSNFCFVEFPIHDGQPKF